MPPAHRPQLRALAATVTLAAALAASAGCGSAMIAVAGHDHGTNTTVALLLTGIAVDCVAGAYIGGDLARGTVWATSLALVDTLGAVAIAAPQ